LVPRREHPELDVFNEAPKLAAVVCSCARIGVCVCGSHLRILCKTVFACRAAGISLAWTGKFPPVEATAWAQWELWSVR
jgi:hypothetical protein